MEEWLITIRSQGAHDKNALSLTQDLDTVEVSLTV